MFWQSFTKGDFNMGFVQGVSGTTNISGSHTAAFTTQNTAAGNMLCCVINVYNPSAVLTGITDSQSNTWVVLPSINPGTYYTYFCYALNTAGGSKPTLTFSFSGGTTDVYYCLGEYSGVNTYRGISTVKTGSSTSLTTNAVTSVSGDLLISFLGGSQALSTLSGTNERENGGNGSYPYNAFLDATASGTKFYGHLGDSKRGRCGR